MEKQIALKLNGETRSVEASDYGNWISVHGIVLVTQTGNKQHIGQIDLNQQGENHIYSERDIIGCSYWGMRGNGSGQRSRMRYIGFGQAA
jgi:hypothetical protein